MFAPACPMENVTLLEGLLCLTSGYEICEVVAKDKVLARTGSRTMDRRSKDHAVHCTLSTKLSPCSPVVFAHAR